MPIVKLSLNETYYQKLCDMASEEGVSIQDYIRSRVFDEAPPFTPADAVQRALTKYDSGESFTLPQLYDDQWTLTRGYAGVFGKQFYQYVSEHCQDQIRFTEMVDYGRHAQYQVL